MFAKLIKAAAAIGIVCTALPASAVMLESTPTCRPLVTGSTRIICGSLIEPGYVIDAGTSVLDITFTGRRYVEIFDDPNETPEFGIAYSGLGSRSLFVEYYLSDENGDPIPGTADTINVSGTFLPDFVLSFLSFPQYPLRFHDLHIEFTLQGTSPLTIRDISILAGVGSNVGRSPTVPEPPVLVLVGMGLVMGLLLRARQRDRHRRERSRTNHDGRCDCRFLNALWLA